jgi:hypothetical protein
MRKIHLAVCVISLLILACNSKKSEPGKKYRDYNLYNLKGDVISEEDSTFVVDSNGKQRPDSLCYWMGEYTDGYLTHHTEIDTNGNKSNATYSHFDNGLWKGMETVSKGKTTYRLDIQLDSAGHYTTAQSYDTTGKMQYYNTDIAMDENGMVTAGKLYKGDSSLVYSFVSLYDKYTYLGGSKFDSSGKETSKQIIKVNDQQDPLVDSTVKKEKDSTITTVKKYSYVYDATGNWTLQTEMNEKGKPTKIIKRVIIYAKKEN